MNLNYVLKRPIITEKTTILNSQGKYVFEVERQATKKEIKEAIEKIFKVKVEKVQTVCVKGKERRMLKTRKRVSKPDWKKAVVKLKEGDKIDLFEIK